MEARATMRNTFFGLIICVGRVSSTEDLPQYRRNFIFVTIVLVVVTKSTGLLVGLDYASSFFWSYSV